MKGLTMKGLTMKGLTMKGLTLTENFNKRLKYYSRIRIIDSIPSTKAGQDAELLKKGINTLTLKSQTRKTYRHGNEIVTRTVFGRGE